jgi:hypothetical protein
MASFVKHSVVMGPSYWDFKTGVDETTGLAVANPALLAVYMPAWPVVWPGGKGYAPPAFSLS